MQNKKIKCYVRTELINGTKIIITEVLASGHYEKTSCPMVFAGYHLQDDPGEEMSYLEISENIYEWCLEEDQFFCRTDYRYGIHAVIQSLENQKIIKTFGDQLFQHKYFVHRGILGTFSEL
jgi:hypothetical protein